MGSPIQLHHLDRLSLHEVHAMKNPLAAEMIENELRSRRRRRLCDLCHEPLPRVLRNGLGPPRPRSQVAELRHIGANARRSDRGNLVIGTRCCNDPSCQRSRS